MSTVQQSFSCLQIQNDSITVKSYDLPKFGIQNFEL